MRRIIDGYMYNTETADEVSTIYRENPGIYTPGIETLYRKKKGEFFLYIWGEFLGSDISPLSDDEAKEWLEENGTATEYESVFGPVPE